MGISYVVECVCHPDMYAVKLNVHAWTRIHTHTHTHTHARAWLFLTCLASTRAWAPLDPAPCTSRRQVCASPGRAGTCAAAAHLRTMGARAVRPRGRHDRFPTRKTKKSAQSQTKNKNKTKRTRHQKAELHHAALRTRALCISGGGVRDSTPVQNSELESSA